MKYLHQGDYDITCIHLFVCKYFQQDYTKRAKKIFMKLGWRMSLSLKETPLSFCAVTDKGVKPGHFHVFFLGKNALILMKKISVALHNLLLM